VENQARSLTVAIPSYNRRSQVVELVQGLGPQLRVSNGDVRVLVGLDGSTDDSLAALRATDIGVPLEVLDLPHHGAARARNAMLERCTTELIWFLDDDMIPAPGLVAQHRAAHAGGEQKVVIGPCMIPPNAITLGFIRDYWRTWNERLRADGQITSFDTFSVANTSAPVEVFRAVGGLDGSLPGYGYEDYDLGLRLMEAGIPIYFEPEAVAHHHQIRSLAQSCRNRREAGANLVRFVQRHPERLETLVGRVHLPPNVIHILGVTRRNPDALDRISSVAVKGDNALHRVIGRGSGRLRRTAHMCALSAGIAELGGDTILDTLIARSRS
jgi:GT2 family glycosyltransferase